MVDDLDSLKISSPKNFREQNCILNSQHLQGFNPCVSSLAVFTVAICIQHFICKSVSWFPLTLVRLLYVPSHFLNSCVFFLVPGSVINFLSLCVLQFNLFGDLSMLLLLASFSCCVFVNQWGVWGLNCDPYT